VPEDVEELIEAVYGKDDWSENLPERLRQDWQESYKSLEKRRREYTTKARTYSILPPTYGDEVLEDFNCELEEDNPAVHSSLQALTRISEPTVQVICLYGEKSSPSLDKEHQAVVDTDSCPALPMAKELLKRSVNISHRGLVYRLIEKGELVSEEWRKSPLLRHHYLLYFDKNDICSLDNYKIRLDEELGLIIDKTDTAGGNHAKLQPC
jgi:hypothetical protein